MGRVEGILASRRCDGISSIVSESYRRGGTERACLGMGWDLERVCREVPIEVKGKNSYVLQGRLENLLD